LGKGKGGGRKGTKPSKQSSGKREAEGDRGENKNLALVGRTFVAQAGGKERRAETKLKGGGKNCPKFRITNSNKKAYLKQEENFVSTR